MRRHLTPSMVIALIALFLALGGVSYAAMEIPRNSVGTSQLKASAVTSTKVKDRSLLARDFKTGELPRGEQGPAGERGATGATGPTFSFAYGTVYDNPVSIAGIATVVTREVAVPQAGRLVVVFTGRVFISSGSPNDSAIALCAAWVRPPGGALAPVSQAIPSSPATLVSGSADGAITLTFAVDARTAGTYELSVICSKKSVVGTPGLGFDRYDMTGVLTAT